MKRNFSTFFFFALIILLSSCSFFNRREAGYNHREEKASDPYKDYVPKAQYDQLKAQYDQLLTQSPMNFSLPEKKVDLSEMATSPAELENTVDLFVNEEKKEIEAPIIIEEKKSIASHELKKEEIEDQIYKFQHAEELVEQKNFKKALDLLRILENTPVSQLKANVLFEKGNIFFVQQEYDLAMQIFKKILGQHANSGVVYKTLARLLSCCEKLGLIQEKEKYDSILHDLLGA